MTLAYDSAKALVRERLSEGAAAHSVRVAEMSALLATVYGADVEIARLAGVLHDWDRERAPEALGEQARATGITPSEAEAAVPYLLHARTGAAELRAAFPELPTAVLDAVEKHTLGADEMSDVDMIVYVADMIEPGRDYPGVDDLRERVGTVSLGALFASAYEQSVAYLVAQRRIIHPLTVTVWNRYVARPGR